MGERKAEKSIGNTIVKEGKSSWSTTKIRIGQNFFRATVLGAYENKCCITGISIPELLRASHIKPWKDSNDKTEKLNPSNGLCLNALHDAAFDKGLITISPSFRVIVSDILKTNKKIDETTKNWIISIEGRQIDLPTRNQPSKEFIEYHNDIVFHH